MKSVIYFFVETLLTVLVAASYRYNFGLYVHGPGDNWLTKRSNIFT